MGLFATTLQNMGVVYPAMRIPGWFVKILQSRVILLQEKVEEFIVLMIPG